ETARILIPTLGYGPLAGAVLPPPPVGQRRPITVHPHRPGCLFPLGNHFPGSHLGARLKKDADPPSNKAMTAAIHGRGHRRRRSFPPLPSAPFKRPLDSSTSEDRAL